MATLERLYIIFVVDNFFIVGGVWPMDYNVKCLHYAFGETETRVYSHPVSIGGVKQNKQKLKKDGKRLEIDENERERIMKISMNRTIEKVYELAKSNKWNWFITLTFDQKKVNSFDYDVCKKKLKSWIDLIRRMSPDIKYLIVPELHKSGAYHFHGILSNCPNLPMVFSGHFTRKGEPIYNIVGYKLGWSTATEVENNQAVAKYVTKYITKELVCTTKNRKRYWVSHNVDRPIMQYYLLDGSDRHVLQYELDADNDHVKYVHYQVAGAPRAVSYYINKNLVLAAKELDI